MGDLFGDIWKAIFDSFGNDPATQRMGCLRATAWFFLLATLMLLTGGVIRVFPGPWVWVGVGACAVVSLVLFWLSSRPRDEEGEDD